MARHDAAVTVTVGEAVIPQCLFRVILVYRIQRHELTWNVIWHLLACCTAEFGENSCFAKDDGLCLFAFIKCQPLPHTVGWEI